MPGCLADVCSCAFVIRGKGTCVSSDSRQLLSLASAYSKRYVSGFPRWSCGIAASALLPPSAPLKPELLFLFFLIFFKATTRLVGPVN